MSYSVSFYTSKGALRLFSRELGDAQTGTAPLLLLHGLFGSSINWLGIARRLEGAHRLLLPDLRNHGRSPHNEAMSYPDMAEDLARLLADTENERAVLVGHSMGGKAAMWLALTRSELVHALVVVDIAPVHYGHRFDGILDALGTLDLASITDRRAADALLASQLDDPMLRGYLLQNLVRDGKGWRWRPNLPILTSKMEEIRGFPDGGGRQYPGPVLFIYGTASDYLTGSHLPTIRNLFPLARLRSVPGAGHWVYAEKPQAFTTAVQGFLAKV